MQNWTGVPWTRHTFSLDHGEWSGDQVPPEHIPRVFLDPVTGDARPGTAFFKSESDGLNTGVEGNCDYNADNGDGNFHMFWDNPAEGGNSFNAQAPPRYQLFWGDPGGGDAHITIDIRRN
ncbi:hypothetical protein ACIHFE_24395 [Streptomyces sp. NPDC052396]|uniref:hypothetical protein n=1 Tax=Streptomyces sp. NPDC052396 TaxID=3365689 RepID=UPI0037D66A35